MNYTELNKNIQEGNIDHLYIFSGEERSLKLNFIKLLSNALNATVQKIEEPDMNTVLKTLMSKSLLGEKVLIVIDNEKFANEVDTILAKPLKNYIVFLCTEAPKTSLQPQIITFNKMNRAGLIMYIQKNLNIKKSVAEILSVISDDDLCTVKNNIHKLKHFTDGEITSEIIEEVCYIPDTFKIFDMIDAICKKEREKAVYIYHRMKENNVGILSLMYQQYRKVLTVKTALQGGMKVDQISETFSIPKFVVNNCINMAHIYSEKALVNILHKIFDVDFKIKTGQCQDAMVYSMILTII